MLVDFDFGQKGVQEYGNQQFWQWIRGVAMPVIVLDSWCLAFEEGYCQGEIAEGSIRNANCVGHSLAKLTQSGERKKLINTIQVQSQRMTAICTPVKADWILSHSKIPLVFPFLRILSSIDTITASRRLDQIQKILRIALATNDQELLEETTVFISNLPNFKIR